MSVDENSKGSTDDSGVILNASLLSQSSTGSTDFKTVGSFARKRSLITAVADDDESENDENATEVVSRKEKSLGKLCKRFLLAMNEEAQTGNDVHLETVARKMSVEKRRIYDLVNVMEALEAMSKTNKSFYRWHGLSRLPLLMAELAKESLNEDLPAKILQVEQAMCSFTELAPVGQQQTVGSLLSESQSSSKSLSSQGDSIKSGNTCRDRNGKNSLAQLCRRFLMVLLCNPKDKRRVSLDVASTVLIKDPESEGFDPPSRSRCRRLYDIANVLVAMGLIRKVHYLFGTKKIPLFVYCGPEPNDSPEEAVASMAEFLHRNGLTESEASQQPASKFRRVSSDIVAKSLQTQKNSSNSLQRSFSELQKAHSMFALPNISEGTKPETSDDKENLDPASKVAVTSECELPKPVPRPLHRAPLQSLNPSSMAPLNWAIDPFTNFHRTTFGLSGFATNYSVSSILGVKTPTKFSLPSTTLSKATNSPKAFRPVMSRHSTPEMNMVNAAMILGSLCEGQPKY